MARENSAKPPFPIGPDALIVAYYASAELGCFRALGWPMPANILDLFAEFRDRTNGLPTLAGCGLIGALTYFGLDTVGASEKDEMRLRILRGGPWSERERKEILDYCATDVDCPRALIASDVAAHRSAAPFFAVATWPPPPPWNATACRSTVPTLELLRKHWADIQDALIAAIDANYGVYEGRTFKIARLRPLIRHDIPWPQLESGALDLSRRLFRQMAKSYAVIAPLHELRHAICRKCALNDLAVGAGRTQSHDAVRVPRQDRAQSAEQHKIHLRPKRVAARIDQAATGSRRRLC